MNVKHIHTEPPMPNPWNLNVVKFHDSPDGELLHLTLGPGESMLPHIPPVTLHYNFLEGEATVRYGDKYEKVSAGSYLEHPEGTATCVSNQMTEGNVRVLIVKLVKTEAKPVFLDK